jgi:hypothetical protein
MVSISNGGRSDEGLVSSSGATISPDFSFSKICELCLGWYAILSNNME